MTKQTLIFFLILLVLNGLAAQEFIQCQTLPAPYTPPVHTSGYAAERMAPKTAAHGTLSNCKPSELPKIKTQKGQSENISTHPTLINPKQIRVFLEVDSTVYIRFGKDIQSTKNYVNSLFSLVQQAYEYDSVYLTNTGIYIWTSQSHYPGGVNPIALNKFSNAKTMLGQSEEVILRLVSDGQNTGYAYVRPDICGQGIGSSVIYVGDTINAFPSFSRVATLMIHEIGHTLGLNHTFDCVWGPQQDLAIDDCVNPKPICGYVNGMPNPLPSFMGYCPINSLLVGFGQEPGSRMRQNIQASSACLLDTALYSTCQIKNIVTWTECHPSQNVILLKGIVAGNNGGTFNAKVQRLQFPSGTPTNYTLFNSPFLIQMVPSETLDSLVNLPFNTEITLGAFSSIDSTILLSVYQSPNSPCNQTLPIYHSSDCSNVVTAPDLLLSHGICLQEICE